MNPNLEILPFFDEATNTASYLVIDKVAKKAAIIDPVLDYDHRSGKASVGSVDKMLAAAGKRARQSNGCLRPMSTPTTSPPPAL